MVQKVAQTKFTVACIVLQAIMAVLYGVMVRYERTDKTGLVIVT